VAKKTNQKPLEKKTQKPTLNKADGIKEPVTGKKGSIKTKLCIVLAVLSFVLYANTFQNSYVMDDNMFITYNKLVNEGITAIPKLLITAHMEGFGSVSNDTYRPLSLVMFAVENELFGNNPIIGHFFNTLLFAGCVVLLFLFFDKLLDRKKIAIAFIAAALFAVHPIHTEVVANIKSRDELMCFFFAFLSLNLFIDYVQKGKSAQLLTGATCLFLSLLSKETAISFIAVIPLIFFFYQNENKKRSINIIASAVIVSLLFLTIRTVILKQAHLSGNNSSLSFMDNQLVKVPAGASGIATAILGMGYYVKLLFVPYPLLSMYSYATIPFAGFGNILVLLSLTAYILLTALGVYRLVKIKKDPWAFGILFYLATIALFSNIVFLVGALVAERFVFFGSAGFCLIVALGVEKWLMSDKKMAAATTELSVLWKPKVLLFLAPLFLLFGNMTIARNKEWKNDYVLFKTDAEKAPDNAKLNCNVAIVLNTNLANEALRPEVKAQMIEQGITYMQRALEIYPGNAAAHAGLGLLYLRKKMLDSAERQELLALELDSVNTQALSDLAGIYFNNARYAQAISCYKKAINIDTLGLDNYKNIGLCYYHMNEYDSAIINLKKAIPYFLNDKKDIYPPIIITYRDMGKMDSAARYEQLLR